MTQTRLGANDAGFTLIEVLVAMVVAALVLSAASELTRMMVNAEQHANRQQSGQESLIGAAQAFRHVVVHSVPDLRHGRGRALTVGSPNRLMLVSRGPSVMTLDRPVPMVLRVERDMSGSALILAWQDPHSETSREEVLLRKARSLGLAYFGVGRDGGDEKWHQYWDQPLRLPRAVLLRADMAELGIPIDIIGRTRSELPYACMALPHEPRCRSEVAP